MEAVATNQILKTKNMTILYVNFVGFPGNLTQEYISANNKIKLFYVKLYSYLQRRHYIKILLDLSFMHGSGISYPQMIFDFIAFFHSFFRDHVAIFIMNRNLPNTLSGFVRKLRRQGRGLF